MRSLALVFLITLPTGLHAAPTLTHVYPAGGQRGQTITVTATGTFAASASLTINGVGLSAVASKTKGQFDITIAADAIPGVRSLRILDETGASEQRPFLVGTLPELTEHEPNNHHEKPHDLAKLPIVVNGKLEKSGDVDCFAVNLTSGETLVAALEANRQLKSPIDAILQIVSADGFLLDQNHDFDLLDPLIAYSVPKTGRYIVRVFAFPSTPDSSIRFFGSDASIYRLTLTTGAYAIGTRPLVMPRRSSDDVKARFIGWNLGDRVPKITRDEVATLWHPDVPTSFTRPLTSVSVRTLDSVRADEPLIPPFELTGTIDTATPIRVPIVSKKSQKLTLTFGPGISTSPLAPLLTVLGANGQSIAKAEPTKPSGDATTTLTADGPHTLELRDQYGQFHPRLQFHLSATLETPSFAMTVANDRFTLVAGQPLEIPVTITRSGGFAGEVKLTVNGLPKSVKAETVSSKDKLVLKLTSEKVGVQSAFAIVGTSEKLEAFATRARVAAEIPAPSELWLTTIAKK